MLILDEVILYDKRLEILIKIIKIFKFLLIR